MERIKYVSAQDLDAMYEDCVQAIKGEPGKGEKLPDDGALAWIKACISGGEFSRFRSWKIARGVDRTIVIDKPIVTVGRSTYERWYDEVEASMKGGA